MALFLFSSIPTAILIYAVLKRLDLSFLTLKPGALFVFFGILSGILVSALNGWFPVLNTTPKESLKLFSFAILNVGLVEELSKFLFLQLGLFFIISERLKERKTVIFYSILVGTGFALIENISYALVYGNHILIGRTLIAMPMHMCCGFIMGWTITSNMKYNIIIGIAVASAIHGLYDFWAFMQLRVPAIITFWLSLRFMLKEINILKEHGK